MPFGLLSNNSIYVMEIDGKKYNTVTNYIYANLLNNPEYFSILQNINTHEVHKYFNKYVVPKKDIKKGAKIMNIDTICEYLITPPTISAVNSNPLTLTPIQEPCD